MLIHRLPAALALAAMLSMLFGTVRLPPPGVTAQELVPPETKGKTIPFFAASSGGNEVRNAGWFSSGWDRFVQNKALPYGTRHGRVWIHNPFGHVYGEDMSFLQWPEAVAAAAEAEPGSRAQRVLSRLADGAAFTAAMNRLVRAGIDVTVYVGSPMMLDPHDDSYEQWSRRARDTLSPLLAVEAYGPRRRIALGFDATYGQPDSHPGRAGWSAERRRAFNAQRAKLGGPRGYVARWLHELARRGHRIFLEPLPLARSPEMHGFGSVFQPRFLQRAGKSHRFRTWGRWAQLEDVRGEKVLLVFNKDVRKGIAEAHRRGLTALVPAQKLK